MFVVPSDDKCSSFVLVKLSARYANICSHTDVIKAAGRDHSRVFRPWKGRSTLNYKSERSVNTGTGALPRDNHQTSTCSSSVL